MTTALDLDPTDAPTVAPAACPHEVVAARRHRAGWRGVCDACGLAGPGQADRDAALRAWRAAHRRRGPRS